MASIVGRNLRRLADERGLTQREIADALKVTPSQVSHWMAGTYEPRKHLVALAFLLAGGNVAALYEDPTPSSSETRGADGRRAA